MTRLANLIIPVSALTLALLSKAGAQSTSTPAPAPVAPNAQVTFYSSSKPSNAIKGMLPGYKHGPFFGGIFDGDHLLAQMAATYFITFNLAPGPHVLSASSSGYRPSKDALLPITLVANEHYFIRIDSMSRLSTLVIFDIPKAIIEQIPCADAQTENVKAKPLKPKRIWPDGVPLAVAETAFPKCP
jgi:hypothetical protein